MKKFFLILFLILGISSLSSAVTIDYTHTLASDGTLTSSFAGAMIETFDNSTKWSWTGGGHIVSGSLSGKYAAPYNNSYMSAKDSTKYMSADPSGYYSTTFATTYTYFGLFWGSVDSYNTLSFYNGNDLVHSFKGTDITNPGKYGVSYGNQSAPSTNLYVNFYDLSEFDRIVMKSTGYAFEADNLAVGNPILPNPEPATMLLFGFGLIGLARIGRKKQ
ncbi:MAG: PEP-CTERM sorting domain-containing protein [Desulfobacteraceae bacterium]|nr:PEP-CTERM sorting domain-containing protein [Desulfobacteraceae bacterium]